MRFFDLILYRKSYFFTVTLLHEILIVEAVFMSRFFFTLIRDNAKEIAIAIAAIVLLFVVIGVSTYVYFASDLTTKENLMNKNNTGIILLDKNGTVFFKFYEAHIKTFTPLSDIPRDMRHAIIVAEDREFYRHPGFSISAIIAAFIANVRKGDTAYGGSTITQQLVKNTLLTPQKSLMRKYQELILAQEIERRFSKNEILEMYLNSVYLGEGAFGIEQAAKTYFGISASQLNLAQASLLAGFPKAPSLLSPISGNMSKAKERQKEILSELYDQSYITKEQQLQAERQELHINKNGRPFTYQAPHFAIMVRDELIEKYGEERVARSGFKVRTTIDLLWQEYAETIVRQQVVKLASNNVSNGAAVVIDPHTGHVRALVGSINWDNGSFGKVNVATSNRQPGSSFKPIVYAKALENRQITLATRLKDQPITYETVVGDYKPLNYDRKFRGEVTVRRALANSLNVPSVEVMSTIGLPSALESAERFGITTLKDPSRYGLSLVLGAGEVKLLELTNVYATFANGGQKNEITTITEIHDKFGKRVYEHTPHAERVISEDVAFLISSILSDKNARSEAFGDVLDISRSVAVKTGTTENYKDSLTLGYSPDLAIGVWVGNNDGTPMDRIAGSLGAAPIWKSLMERFLSELPFESFVPPSGIVKATVCTIYVSNQKEKPATLSATEEYFLQGTEVSTPCVLPTLEPKSFLPTSAQVSPTPSESSSSSSFRRSGQNIQESDLKKKDQKKAQDEEDDDKD